MRIVTVIYLPETFSLNYVQDCKGGGEGEDEAPWNRLVL
jgi:hypothetical protein